MKPVRLNREIHHWGSILIALPILLTILSGLFLVLKKDVAWIQPPTQSGVSQELSLPFQQVLQIAKSVEEASIASWDDVDRLDVRPGKGLIKVRAHNRWEIQIDSKTGDILQVAYRRSDFIENLHDGSYLFAGYGVWILLPATLILFVLWVTGMIMFFRPYLRQRQARQKKEGP